MPRVLGALFGLAIAGSSLAQRATPAGPGRVPNRPELGQPKATPGVPHADQPREPNLPPSRQPEGPPSAALDQPVSVPAQVTLGKRVDADRLKASVYPVVVIVPNAASYLAAISAWTPKARFPVLLDDGTFEGREAIARFVRGFGPRRVVRWIEPGTTPGGDLERVEDGPLIGAIAAAWGAPKGSRTSAGLIERFKSEGHVPPGIVVTWGHDPAWTAAAALAAGRGQPLALVQTSRLLGSPMPMRDAEGIEEAIERAARETGFTWDATGDQLDAITLCTNAPAKIEAGGKGESLALTDKLGRRGAGVQGARWAWCGQVFGTPSEAAYRAMCSLFIEPSRAWLFNGYESKPGFDQYGAKPAQQILDQVGFKTDVVDSTEQSEEHWRALAARVNPGELVMVTTKGVAEWFDLNPGRAYAGDVPFFDHPAAVFFVHSFSAARLDDRRTIAGRFLEHGAFLYAGSVHEPYLSAFVPPRVLAIRLCQQAPFGAAVRLEGPVWKIAVAGDPLFTLGPALKRLDADPPLEGMKEVGADLRALLTGEHPEEGLRELVLMGRDEDAARLACAMLERSPEKVTPAVALESVMPVFRAGRTKQVAGLVNKLDAKGCENPLVRDALWLSVYPMLHNPDDATLTAMFRTLRFAWEQTTRDAADMTRGWVKVFGMESAAGMIHALRDTQKDDNDRGLIEKAAEQTVGK